MTGHARLWPFTVGGALVGAAIAAWLALRVHELLAAGHAWHGVGYGLGLHAIALGLPTYLVAGPVAAVLVSPWPPSPARAVVFASLVVISNWAVLGTAVGLARRRRRRSGKPLRHNGRRAAGTSRSRPAT